MNVLSDFHQAVSENKVPVVKQFLSEGESPDSLALVLAIQHRANGVLKALIRAGANLNKPEAYWNYTPLVRALREGNHAAFRMLLRAGASIDKGGPSSPPLHVAAVKGLADWVKLCIGAGAKVDKRDGSGNTPLMLAAGLGHLEVVKILLKAGANPRALNLADRTSCELAAENKHTEIVRLLEPLSHRKPPVKRGIAALFQAVSNRDMARVEKCLARGIDVNARDRFGRSPLDKAITFGAIPFVQRLIKAGVDLNKVGPDGLSFLEGAIRAGHTEIAMLLLQAGAVSNPSGNRFEDAIYTACVKGDIELVRRLIKNGSVVRGSGVLLVAARRKSVELMRLLLSEGADANESDSEGWSALRWAMFVPHPPPKTHWSYQLRRLLGDGVVTTIITPPPNPGVVEELVNLLIEDGADVNRTDNRGRPPLAYTASPTVARILIEAGSRLDIRDNEGKAVAYWLRKNGLSPKSLSPTRRATKRKMRSRA